MIQGASYLFFLTICELKGLYVHDLALFSFYIDSNTLLLWAAINYSGIRMFTKLFFMYYGE